MLDAFLEVVCEHEKKASAYQSMVSDLRRLPKSELQALASGRSKLACLLSSDDSDSWLEKFVDTPLHEQALALEQESLEQEIAKEQRRLEEAEENDAEREVRDAEYRAYDAIRLKKRILDLELNKLRLGEYTGESEAEEGEEEVPVDELEESEETEPVVEEEEELEPEEPVEEPAATKKAPAKESDKSTDEDVKKAAARMRQRLQKVAEALATPVQQVSTLGLQKQALGSLGMLRGLGRAAATGFRQDGAGRALSNVGRGIYGYARKNPKAALGAAGLGAAGLGAAGGVMGFGLGRATAR